MNDVSRRSCMLAPLWILSLLILIMADIEYEARHARQPVLGNPPDSFPVLIIKPGMSDGIYNPSVVRYIDLKKSGHFSHMVPLGRAGELNGQLRRKSDSGNAQVSFKARELSGKRQSLMVVRAREEDGFTHTETSWYTAETDGIAPQYYASTVDNLYGAAILLPFAVVANTILWWIGGLLLRILWRRKRPTLPTF